MDPFDGSDGLTFEILPVGEKFSANVVDRGKKIPKMLNAESGTQDGSLFAPSLSLDVQDALSNEVFRHLSNVDLLEDSILVVEDLFGHLDVPDVDDVEFEERRLDHLCGSRSVDVLGDDLHVAVFDDGDVSFGDLGEIAKHVDVRCDRIAIGDDERLFGCALGILRGQSDPSELGSHAELQERKRGREKEEERTTGMRIRVSGSGKRKRQEVRKPGGEDEGECGIWFHSNRFPL